MWKCPVCDQENTEATVCPACGYDRACDYEQYPTADVSVVDLTARLSRTTTYAEICYAVRHASETYMKDIIGYTTDQVVSTDLIADPCPCVFDEKAGIMLDHDFVKLIAWYDNEFGYSNMVVRMLQHMYDVDQAAEWYRKAADQGHKDAQRALADCYENGRGVKTDKAQARYWREKAKNNNG